MTNITSLDQHRKRDAEEKDPHLSGYGKCISCRHEWVSVAPVGVTALECPQCETMTGVWSSMIYPHEDVEIWQCDCGGDVFWLLRDAFMCLRCGTEQCFGS